ncbi:MAG: hypothetical protein DMF76_25615 [Acidobacteria bacterium]|nr:MAG: hypothetical protein DMF76_25615 [Acidobacteriota bacterium]
MSRIIKEIEVEGKPAVALFDTGATFTYVLSSLISETEIDIKELAIIEGKIEGLDFFSDAVPVEELGRADGHDLDALIGALTMEPWEIKLDRKTGELDLEGLRQREFTEF